MKICAILLFLLSGLLAACTTAASMTPQVPSKTPEASEAITQSPSRTFPPTTALTNTPTQSAAEYCAQLLKNYQPADGFQTYCDADYGFALDYPEGWRITGVARSPDTATYPNQVRRAQRYEAVDMSNYIRTDTYHMYGSLTFPERVEYSIFYSGRAFPDHRYPSIDLGGHEAYAILNCWQQDYSSVMLFFKHGEYYTILELKAITKAGLDTNWRIASSVQTPGFTPDKNVIPQEIIDDSYQLLSCNAPPTPQPGSLLLERVARTGGSINGIAVTGDIAYVGIGPRVAAIDVSQHASPRLISQSQPLPGLVTQLLPLSPMVPGRLIVSAGNYLFELDISDPGAMDALYPMELPGAITAMALDGANRTLYIGGMVYQYPYKYTGFIQSMRISADGVPDLLEYIEFPEQITSLALGNGTIFVGTFGTTAGLYSINHDPSGRLSTPKVAMANTKENSYAFYSLQVIGERLFAGVNMDFQAFDITNPANPEQVWKEFIGFTAHGFAINGTQLDIFGWAPAGAYIPAYISLTPPEPLTGVPLGQTASIVAVHAGDFLVAYHDFEIFTSPELKLIGTYLSPVTFALGSAADDHTLYTVDAGAVDSRDYATLRLFSLPDLEPLGQVQTDIPGSCCWFSGIAIEGDRAYLAASDGLWIYDVSKPVPTLLAKPEIIDGQLNAITAIQLGDKRLLFMPEEISGSSFLTAFDLTDLQKPVMIGQALHIGQGRVFQMIWYDGALYAAQTAIREGDSDGFYKVEFQNRQLTLLESIEIPGNIFAMAVNHGYIALTGTDGWFLFSEAQPLSSVPIAQMKLATPGRWVDIFDHQAVVVAGDDFGVAQLLVFDLQDAARPRQTKSMDIAYDMGRMGSNPISAPSIVLAGGSSGIEVWDYQILK